jgi:hypothetical protein
MLPSVLSIGTSVVVSPELPVILNNPFCMLIK